MHSNLSFVCRQLIPVRIPGLTASASLNGKSKSDLSAIDDFHKHYVDQTINHRELLPKDYKFFGSNSNVENLELFLKHNPLFAAIALSKVNEQIAVVSMGDSAGPKSWFKRAVDLLDDSCRRWSQHSLTIV